MATVYQANDGSVFEAEQIIEKEGIRYALDITSISKIKAYPLRELTTLGESFDVIVMYFPGYETCNEATLLDDLDCLIDGEYDDEKLRRLTAIWGSDPEIWKKERDMLYQELLNEAIQNYKNKI